MPKVSVIIPVYNVEKYLRECLDSVVNQTLKDIEIICIDDGSTDSSLEILQEYAAKDDRFIILTQENKGAGAARNNGLKIAKGEYLSFLDSDDIFDSQMLNILYTNNIKYKSDISICGAKMYDYAEMQYFNMSWLIKINDGVYYTSDIAKDLFNSFSPNCWNKMFDRNFITKNKIFFQNLTHCNDVYFSWYALALSKKIYVTSKELICYRYNTHSQTTDKIHEKPLNILKAFNALKKNIDSVEIIESLYKASVAHFSYAIKNADKNDLNYYISKFRKFYPKNIFKEYECKLKNIQTIPIVFATNDIFAKFMSVAITSLIDNGNKNYFYQIFVLHDDLKPDTMKTLCKMNSKYCDIQFLNIAKHINGMNLYSKAHYSKEMYYRILIPNILKQYDKIIYLDGDLIVKTDISKLYNEKLDGYYLAAVQNYLNEGMYVYVTEKLGLMPDKYFNSGVLLINCKLWRKYNIKDKCFELISKYPKLACPDQDLLNLVCYNNVKYLNPKWNFMWQHIFSEELKWPLKKCYVDLYEIQKKSFNIIHYTSCKKPWNNINADYANIWWGYVAKSPFYSEIRKLSKECDYIQKLFSVKNQNIHKIITILGLRIKVKSKKLIERKRFTDINNKFKKFNKKLKKQKEKLKIQKNLVEQQNINILENQTLLNEQFKKYLALSNLINDYKLEIAKLNKKLEMQEENIQEQSTRIITQEKILHEQSIRIAEQKDFIHQKIKEFKNNLISQQSTYQYELCKYMPETKYPEYLQDWYKRVTGETLNLDNPQTYNEKIQWIKLYDSIPIKTQLADKYLARDWVKEKIGEEYLIPLLGVWDNFNEIDFNELPDKFVLKCNHGCAYNIIVKDKYTLDIEDARKKINNWMNENFAYKVGLELHYANINRKIIAEQYIENDNSDLYDYKFWCFDGKVKYIQFLSERNTSGLKMAFYDRDWNKQNFVYSYPLDTKTIEKPDNLDEMIYLAEKLAEGFNHVRVDFYRLNNGKIYFGEMTFTSCSGMCKWTPNEENLIMGQMIKLPTDEKILTEV